MKLFENAARRQGLGVSQFVRDAALMRGTMASDDNPYPKPSHFTGSVAPEPGCCLRSATRKVVTGHSPPKRNRQPS